MIDLSYEFIKGIFDDILTNDSFAWFNYSYKFLAASFLVLNLYSSFLSKKFDWGELDLPLDKSKLINALVVIFLIASYDQILILLDGLFTPLDNFVNNYNPLFHDFTDEEITDAEGDMGAMAYLKKAAADFIEVVRNPLLIILKMAYGIFWILDNIVYGLFLVERFFFLTVLKLLGPIVFTMAVFEKFRDLLYKWFKLYAAYYLLILPFFLVIYITNQMFQQMGDAANENTLINIHPGFKYMAFATITGVSFYLKFRLFKKSSDIVYKLFAQ